MNSYEEAIKTKLQYYIHDLVLKQAVEDILEIVEGAYDDGYVDGHYMGKNIKEQTQ